MILYRTCLLIREGFAFSVANAANFFFPSCILVFGTFRYQLELCKKALEENIIVYLETGCGKTHIAVLLIYEMGHLIRQPQKSACIFLAPTVALVHQVRFSCLKIFFLDLLFDFWMIYTFKINVAAYMLSTGMLCSILWQCVLELGFRLFLGVWALVHLQSQLHPLSQTGTEW